MTGVLSIWWVWLGAALALAILEVLIPAWVFLGFAIGAGLMGLVLLIGITPGPAGALLIFAILSLAAYLALRRALGSARGEVKLITRDINEN